MVGSTPTVAVALLAHNREGYLHDAIESVRAQQGRLGPIELVIVKNFSDKYVDTLLWPGKLTVVSLDTPNFGESVLAAANSASAEIICLLDDDDLFDRRKIEVVAGEFGSDPLLNYYHNSFLPVGIDGRQPYPLAHTNPDRRRSYNSKEVSLKEIVQIERASGGFNDSCISVRKEVILDRRVELSRVVRSADTFLFAAALAAGGQLVIDDRQLTLYRVHSSTSRASSLEGPRIMSELAARRRRAVRDAFETWSLVRGQNFEPFFRYRLASEMFKLAVIDPSESAKLALDDYRSLLLLGLSIHGADSLMTLFMASLARVSPSTAQRLIAAYFANNFALPGVPPIVK